jgi:TPR repeat protein
MLRSVYLLWILGRRIATEKNPVGISYYRIPVNFKNNTLKRRRIMKLSRFLSIVLLSILAFPAFSNADQLEDAKTALDKKDYEKAYELLSPLAKARSMAREGDTEAMYNLGSMCLKDRGGEQDKGVCLKVLEQAAMLGHIGSAEMINKIYKKGLYGIPRDRKTAAEWKDVAKGFEKGIDGKWARVIARRTGDRRAYFFYELKAENNKLTGTMRDAQLKKIPIEDGKIDGNKISFKVPMKWNGMDLTHHHTGTFLGNALSLSITTDKGDGSGESPPLTFAAKRSRGNVNRFMGYSGHILVDRGQYNNSYERMIDHGNSQSAWTGQTFFGN